MSINEQLLARVEALRIPLDDDASPMDWKDWYHFVLLDRKTGLRVLVNLNMSGRPGQGEIQTSFLVNRAPNQLLPNLPSHHKTFGIAFSQEWKSDMVSRDPLYLQGKDIHLEINGKNSNVTVENSRTQQSIRFQGVATASPILVTEDETFGTGFVTTTTTLVASGGVTILVGNGLWPLLPVMMVEN